MSFLSIRSSNNANKCPLNFNHERVSMFTKPWRRILQVLFWFLLSPCETFWYAFPNSQQIYGTYSKLGYSSGVVHSYGVPCFSFLETLYCKHHKEIDHAFQWISDMCTWRFFMFPKYLLHTTHINFVVCCTW